MKRVHIIGGKNSGKTTLVADLVGHLTGLGYRVGTVKHTHHRHELDTPGKDSYRHREAGAAVVGILSPAMNAIFWPARPGLDAATDYDTFLGMFSGCDLVLVEGHSQAEGPKIEVCAAVSDRPLAASDRSVLAVVTDDAVQVDVPVWPRSDLSAVATRLLACLDGGD